MKQILLSAVLCVVGLLAAAQGKKNGAIKVAVQNHLQQPVENATVELLRSKDSGLVRTAVSDRSGNAEFNNLSGGSYIISVSGVGYARKISSLIQSDDAGPASSTTISLQPSEKTNLKDVTVSGKKPFIQKLNDRIVVNVENSIVNAGSSAFDVLERSPGIQIDPNDNISMRGKSGVTIMIDGKPSPMSGADLINFLRGLPSNSIERIDLITNPSAKYDAAGNSGIIDIKLKKDKRYGSNGSLTAGYGQGVYPKANAGGTFNYRNKKVNVFGNYNYAYRIGLNHLLLDRNFYENGVYNGGDLKDNYNKPTFNTNTARLGMDFFPGKKTIIGFVVNGNFNHFKRQNHNGSVVIDPQGYRSSTFQSRATNNDHNNNVVANVNFKHTFDSTGKELTADVDYGLYYNTSLTMNSTNYFKLDGSQQQPNYTLNGDQDGKLSFFTAKADYVNPLRKGAKWETGVKTSYVSSDNDAKFWDVSNGTPENDVNKTNHFLYKEYNNAGYINFSKEFKKFDIQVGLRGEHTRISTEQKVGNVLFDSSYFQLFPSAFFNYHLKEDQTIGFSVSRRIDRPGYSQLNPFLFLIDVTTYATGQPGLLPQLTWAYELSYTHKNLNFSLNYSHTTNNQVITLARFKEVFPNIPSPDNVTVQIPINISSSDYFGITVAAPVRINKWWNMINNGSFYYERFHGYFSGTNLNNGKPAADVRTNNTFTFGKGWTAELNASLNTGGQYGFMVMDPQWGLSVGAQKTIMKGKGIIRFNMTDIFWTNLPKAVVTFDNYIEKWHAYRETRVANLTFTYRFGNNKVQAARRRTTGSEEERQRAQ